jgi:hypothetical protein
MRTEAEVRLQLAAKERLVQRVRESLKVDLSSHEVENHPAVQAQTYYIRALKWVLGQEADL